MRHSLDARGEEQRQPCALECFERICLANVDENEQASQLPRITIDPAANSCDCRLGVEWFRQAQALGILLSVVQQAEHLASD